MNPNQNENTFNELGYDYADSIIAKHNKRRDDKLFLKDQLRLTVFSILVSGLLIAFVYFLLPVSKVNAVSVSGNLYLPDDYVKELSEITLNSRYYLVIPTIVESRIENDPMIEDCTVTLSEDHSIVLTVTEKKVIGYQYDEEALVILSDGTTAELKSEYLEIIAKVPLITGFTDDGEIASLAEAMSEVDQSVIEQMSEIDEYALSYDSDSIRILMRNGSYFIGNYGNISLVNSFDSVYEQLTDKTLCLFAADTNIYTTDDDKNVVYSAVCPWNDTETEYWTDANGDYILNSSGEQIVKNYYTDESGNYALDANGNKIAIPIDENGNEVTDGDFLTNYAAGYYATGTLVIP